MAATCNVTASEVAARAVAATFADNWTKNCVNRLDWNALLGSAQGGLLGQAGQPMSCFNNDTWGITKAVCDRYCSIGQMPVEARFDWTQFGSGFNSYFLPWVALTAQLPYQTGAFRNDLMSGMLAVGSPTLIIFSLGITISNRRWAKRRFHHLFKKAQGHPATNQDWILHRIKSMAFLLEEAQQEPLRVNDRADFHSFTTQETETSNWTKLLKRLHLTRRGITASLVAQNILALLTWIITVLGATFSPGQGTQTAAGVLWMWLTPVVIGWVAVGVQTGVRSVEEALDEAFESREHQNAPFGSNWNPIRSDSVTIDTERPKQRQWIARSLDFHGDELRKGPLYNYARAPTWWKFARSMEKSAAGMIEHELHKTVSSRTAATEKGAAVAVAETATGTDCGHAYPPLSKFLAEDRWRLAWPAVVALFIQLGNTFGAFVMAYQTLPVGLGCNSGGYLLYGIGSTAAWICFVGSTLMSHEVQYRRERGHSSTVRGTRVLSVLAKVTLIAGKFIAVLNCIWLILSTVFEIGGLYNTCYCYSSSLGLGSKAWVMLWKPDTTVLIEAGNWWVAGVSLATIVCIGSMIVLVVLALHGRPRRELL